MKNTIDTDVLIVGAGPIGLFLANECARRELRFRIVEENSSQSEHSKALAIFPRTLEIFDMAGLVDSFLEKANRVTAVSIVTHGHTLAHMRFAPKETPYSFVAMVPQDVTERLFGGGPGFKRWQGPYETKFVSATDQGDHVAATLLPVAFHLRQRYASCSGRSLRTFALKYPEQFLFFAPVVLVSFMIAVKMNPGMVTLSWGIEGLMVILLGLIASQRSYRITGLFLLLLCVGKIVCLDAWHLVDRDRYITFIVLGAALLLVSMLYGKYRDVVRRLL